MGERPLYTSRTGLALVAAIAVTGVAGYLVSRAGLPHGSPAPVPTAGVLPDPRPMFPPSTTGYSVADDVNTNQVIVFGGIADNGTTWLWDGQFWELAVPKTSPPGRIDAAMAYDPALKLVLMFGGHSAPGTDLTDTWGWNGVTWRELDKGTGAAPPSDASMAWDPAADEMVLVAAAPSAQKTTTWTWSGAHWTSRNSPLPYPASAVVIGYDPSTHLLMAVGTSNPTGPADGGPVQTWAWNGSGWRRLSSPNVPVAYSLFGLGWDPSSNSLLLFTFGSEGSLSTETWAWNGSTWLEYSQDGLPILDGELVVSDSSLYLVGALMTGSSVPTSVQVWLGRSGSWAPL